MKLTIENEEQARRYLLGNASDEDQTQIEQRLLSDDEFYDSLSVIESELIDDYVMGTLTEGEREMFESHFLKTPERRRRLSYVAKLRDRAIKYPSFEVVEPIVEPPKPSPPRRVKWWNLSLMPSYLKLAAAVILVAVGLMVWWLTRPSEIDKGLTALNRAYSEQRPTEARITEFDYAPLPRVRGSEQGKVDSTSLRRAEITLLDELETNPNPAVHHALGRLYLAERKFDDAIKRLNEAIKGEPNNAQFHADYGAALLEKAKEKDGAQANFEEFAQSLEHLNKALELNDSLLEALFNRALCKQYMKLFAQAEEDWRSYLSKDSKSRWAEEARQYLKQLEDQKSKGARSKEHIFEDFLKAYQANDDGRMWEAFRLSRSRTGNIIAEKLIELYLNDAAQHKVGESNAHLRMLRRAGELEAQKANDAFTLDQARYYEQATPAQLRITAQARGLIKSAGDKFNQSEIDDAISLYTKARRLFEQSGNDCEAIFAEGWLGNCYLRIPKAEQSLKVFDRLSEVCERKQYKWSYAQALNAISDAQTSLDALSKALDYAALSLELSEQIQDVGGMLRNLQQFVSMHLKFGNYSESLRFCSRAFDLAYTIYPDPKQVWPFYHETALNLYWLGLLNGALAFEKEALILADESKWPLIKSRSYERLGLIYEKLQNYDEAIRNGQIAVEEGNKIASETSRQNIVAHSTLRLAYLYKQAGNVAKALESYDQAIQLYSRLDFPIYLYEAHKGKLMSFISLGNDSFAKEELNTVLSLFERYRSQILEESNRNSFFDAGQHVYDIAADFAYSRMNDATTAFEYSEACRARSLLELIHTDAVVIDGKDGPEIKLASVTQPLRFLDIQRRLPENVQILQYSVLDDRLLMWVVSKKGIEGKAQNISSVQLSDKVSSYIELISKSDKKNINEINEQARELYAILISPIRPILDEQSQLCIVPDKILNYLPYGALVSPTSGDYLIEDHRYVLSPSASIFIACSEAARSKGRLSGESALSVGNPTFDRSQNPSLPDLPSAGEEAERVARFYRPGVALINNEATGRHVKREMARADVVHLASHYVLNGRKPLLSKLLLARDADTVGGDSSADLHAYEIYKMKLPRTRLAVLSACQTGVERTYRGEGAISIARPFISAGVPIVIASLWPVDSDSTADLMIGFHKHRKQEARPTAEALRQAQLDMLNSADKRYDHPYYWASFAAIGGYTTF